MEWLKAILGDALTDELQQKINAELPKHFALKSDFNARGEEIKTLTAQVETANTSLKDLSAKADSSETLKADLAKITGDFDTYKADTAKREKQSVIKGKARDLVAKKFNPDAVDYIVNSMDLDAWTLNEAGEIVDGESKITKLAESKPGLVLVTNVNGTPPQDKETPKTSDLDKLSDTDYFKSLATEK